MAAVTVDKRHDTVFGDLAVIIAQIDIAANDDTFDTNMVSGKVLGAWATPANSATQQIGVTISGSTITFKVVGAQTNVQLLVVGIGR